MKGHAAKFGDGTADVGDDRLRAAQTRGFLEAIFKLWNRAHFAAEAQFADRERAGAQRAVVVR